MASEIDQTRRALKRDKGIKTRPLSELKLQAKQKKEKIGFVGNSRLTASGFEKFFPNKTNQETDVNTEFKNKLNTIGDVVLSSELKITESFGNDAKTADDIQEKITEIKGIIDGFNSDEKFVEGFKKDLRNNNFSEEELSKAENQEIIKSEAIRICTELLKSAAAKVKELENRIEDLNKEDDKNKKEEEIKTLVKNAVEKYNIEIIKRDKEGKLKEKAISSLRDIVTYINGVRTVAKKLGTSDNLAIDNENEIVKQYHEELTNYFDSKTKEEEDKKTPREMDRKLFERNQGETKTLKVEEGVEPQEDIAGREFEESRRNKFLNSDEDLGSDQIVEDEHEKALRKAMEEANKNKKTEMNFSTTDQESKTTPKKENKVQNTEEYKVLIEKKKKIKSQIDNLNREKGGWINRIFNRTEYTKKKSEIAKKEKELRELEIEISRRKPTLRENMAQMRYDSAERKANILEIKANFFESDEKNKAEIAKLKQELRKTHGPSRFGIQEKIAKLEETRKEEYSKYRTERVEALTSDRNPAMKYLVGLKEKLNKENLIKIGKVGGLIALAAGTGYILNPFIAAQLGVFLGVGSTATTMLATGATSGVISGVKYAYDKSQGRTKEGDHKRIYRSIALGTLFGGVGALAHIPAVQEMASGVWENVKEAAEHIYNLVFENVDLSGVDKASISSNIHMQTTAPDHLPMPDENFLKSLNNTDFSQAQNIGSNTVNPEISGVSVDNSGNFKIETQNLPNNPGVENQVNIPEVSKETVHELKFEKYTSGDFNLTGKGGIEGAGVDYLQQNGFSKTEANRLLENVFTFDDSRNQLVNELSKLAKEIGDPISKNVLNQLNSVNSSGEVWEHIKDLKISPESKEHFFNKIIEIANNTKLTSSSGEVVTIMDIVKK